MFAFANHRSKLISFNWRVQNKMLSVSIKDMYTFTYDDCFDCGPLGRMCVYHTISLVTVICATQQEISLLAQSPVLWTRCAIRRSRSLPFCILPHKEGLFSFKLGQSKITSSHWFLSISLYIFSILSFFLSFYLSFKLVKHVCNCMHSCHGWSLELSATKEKCK